MLSLALGPCVANGLARFSYALILPAMRADLTMTYTQAGWLNTANALGYLAGAALTLVAVSRLGAALIYRSGYVVTALSVLATWHFTSIESVTALRFISGVGAAGVFIAGGALAAAVFDDESRSAAAIGTYFGGSGLGIVASGLVLPQFLDARGPAAWPEAWGLMGAASCACLLASFSVRFAQNSRKGATATGHTAVQLAGVFLPGFVGYFLFACGYIVYMTFLAAWMAEQGLHSGEVSLVWCTIGLAVLATPWAWRGLLRHLRGGKALSLASAGTAAGVFLALSSDRLIIQLLAGTIFGLSFFAAPAAASALVRRTLPQHQWGAGIAAFTLVFAIGQAAGPVGAGLLSDALGTLRAGAWAAAAVLACSAMICLLQGEPSSRTRLQNPGAEANRT